MAPMVGRSDGREGRARDASLQRVRFVFRPVSRPPRWSNLGVPRAVNNATTSTRVSTVALGMDLLVIVLPVACGFGVSRFSCVLQFVNQRFVLGFTRPSDFFQAWRPTRRSRGDTARGARKACNVCGLCASLPVSFGCDFVRTFRLIPLVFSRSTGLLVCVLFLEVTFVYSCQFVLTSFLVLFLLF